MIRTFGCAAVLLLVFGVHAETIPPAVLLGERLTLETRFAQFFFANSNGDVNAVLPAGDPVLDTTETTGAPFIGAFAGKSMNCAACHLEDQHLNQPGGRMRNYADFARRSPIPGRNDGQTRTPRNSPSFVNSTSPNEVVLLHYDGEFSTMPDLVKGGFTGRNFGWQASEYRTAVRHIAQVIRSDDGTGELALQYGGSYRSLLSGAPSVPAEFRLPPAFVFDLDKASDQKILEVVANLVAAFVNSRSFSQDEGGFDKSPYDVFLKKNNLPRKPDRGESPAQYGRRLRGLLNQLEAPQFVTDADGSFRLHAQRFEFGALELQGLRIFMADAGPAGTPPGRVPPRGVGNCMACHAPPLFTDRLFHNTGVAQEEYDAVHGAGAFMNLAIPDWNTRRKNFEASFPATSRHPNASGPFRSIPSSGNPMLTDLGLWNIFGNPDVPKPQGAITRILKGLRPDARSKDDLLNASIALFKSTPLRDLGDSGPYLHNGSRNTLEGVLQFYREMGRATRDGRVRNADPAMRGVMLAPEDIAPLAAFMRALNEDFED